MRCYNHPDLEAVGICLGCGKALCPRCSQTTDPGILVCSENCGVRANSGFEMVNQIRQKTLNQNKVGGIFCFLGGAIFIFFGLFNLTKPHFFHLAIFLFATGISVIITGVMFLKVAKKSDHPTKA